ncbi:conserved exported hypothetical protein [Candidatus Terasakiella magnetica]|uniref:Porin n=1 Tax=Candidatus Terasakiella magnetica TaxID=1867952 RepID=A0A1C3RFK4_9PROT|nr:outer membrane beta-barrel protein [Candidatus Terasakiella magnetica]SCA56035.1 conserved exported hypothetical protein [Candidatus Terasakiella magnetica]
MKFVKTSLLTLLASTVALPVLAEEAGNKAGKGWLAREIIGDKLEKEYGIQIDGLAQFSVAFGEHASDSNDDFSATGNGGPLFFKEDDGFHMDQLHLFVHKDAKSSVVSRVTPTPAPAPEEIDIGFGFRSVYGSAAYFMTTEGFDDGWSLNGDSADPYAPNSTGEVYRLAIPEMYVDVSTPLLGGTNFMVGSWMSPVGDDIGFPMDPPNKFYSHPWSFQYTPAKHVGALMSSKLAQNESGIWGAEFGVVRGWNNMDDKNGDFSYIANLRWRSNDMRTWIDLESIHGNEEESDNSILSNNPGPLRVKSTDGAMRHLYVLDASHAINDKYTVRAAGIYGTQEAGNITSDPGAAAGHLITKDSKWYGLTGELSYQYSPQTTWNFRAEWLNDDNDGDAAKFNAQAGDYYGLTANANYKMNDFVQLRPEVRWDKFNSSVDNVNYFPNNENDQFSFMFDAVFNF